MLFIYVIDLKISNELFYTPFVTTSLKSRGILHLTVHFSLEEPHLRCQESPMAGGCHIEQHKFRPWSFTCSPVRVYEYSFTHSVNIQRDPTLCFSLDMKQTHVFSAFSLVQETNKMLANIYVQGMYKCMYMHMHICKISPLVSK